MKDKANGTRCFMASSLFDLTGRTALVTGASRGIAASIATALAENGARVAINYSAKDDARVGLPDAADQLRRSLQERGCDVHFIDVDLLEEGASEVLCSAAKHWCDDLDILVLSASLQVHCPFLQISGKDTERQVQLNFLNPIRLLQRILPDMMQRGFGRVLTIGSVQETVPSPEMPVYSAMKAAQLNLVQNLAAQYAGHGVQINNLSPGLVETDRNAFKRLDTGAWKENARLANPMGRAALPADMVGAALFLCSDAAGFVTGANLHVTGGGHIPVPLADIERSRLKVLQMPDT